MTWVLTFAKGTCQYKRIKLRQLEPNATVAELSIVKRFNQKHGYGFISQNDTPEHIFVHCSANTDKKNLTTRCILEKGMVVKINMVGGNN